MYSDFFNSDWTWKWTRFNGYQLDTKDSRFNCLLQRFFEQYFVSSEMLWGIHSGDGAECVNCYSGRKGWLFLQQIVMLLKVNWQQLWLINCDFCHGNLLVENLGVCLLAWSNILIAVYHYTKAPAIRERPHIYVNNIKYLNLW